MTFQMIQVPADDWADLVYIADRVDRADEPVYDNTPETHAFTPYSTYDAQTPCGLLGCGASQANPIHYV